MTKDRLKQYTETSYSGRKLLETHDLNETGVWRIFGEDPNCDLGGPHYEPDLGLFEGKLADVIAYAVELPNFWQWGGGGRIVKIDAPKKITSDSVARRAVLKKERDELEARLKELNKELGDRK